MKDLPNRLQSIPTLKHAIYADDITLWCNTGSPAQQEETIQKGIDAVHQYTGELGLTCSREKSEYIVVTNATGRKAEDTRNYINLNIANVPIERRNSIRILGFWLQDNGKWNVWLTRLTVQIQQIYHM